MSDEKKETSRMALTTFEQMLERHGFESIDDVPEVHHFQRREVIEVMADFDARLKRLEKQIKVPWFSRVHREWP